MKLSQIEDVVNDQSAIMGIIAVKLFFVSDSLLIMRRLFIK